LHLPRVVVTAEELPKQLTITAHSTDPAGAPERRHIT